MSLRTGTSHPGDLIKAKGCRHTMQNQPVSIQLDIFPSTRSSWLPKPCIQEFNSQNSWFLQLQLPVNSGRLKLYISYKVCPGNEETIKRIQHLPTQILKQKHSEAVYSINWNQVIPIQPITATGSVKLWTMTCCTRFFSVLFVWTFIWPQTF